MALIDISTVASNATFRAKVKGAMVRIAVLISGEQLIEGKEILLEKRHNLATDILRNPEAMTEPFVWAVAQSVSIAAESNDSDIEFTVSSVFNDIAGVKNAEL